MNYMLKVQLPPWQKVSFFQNRSKVQARNIIPRLGCKCTGFHRQKDAVCNEENSRTEKQWCPLFFIPCMYYIQGSWQLIARSSNWRVAIQRYSIKRLRTHRVAPQSPPTVKEIAFTCIDGEDCCSECGWTSEGRNWADDVGGRAGSKKFRGSKFGGQNWDDKYNPEISKWSCSWKRTKRQSYIQ